MRALCQFLSETRMATGFKPGPMAFCSWNKTLTCLRTHVLILDSTPDLVLYLVGFEKSWMEFSETLGIRTSSSQGCANPRCAAPNAPVYWECDHCHVALYCGQLCQAACVTFHRLLDVYLWLTNPRHWLYAPNPHKVECTTQPEGGESST